MGRYNITLNLKHRAIYFSDFHTDSFLLLPSLFGRRRSFLAQRRFAVSQWDEKTYLAKVSYITQSS